MLRALNIVAFTAHFGTQIALHSFTFEVAATEGALVCPAWFFWSMTTH